MSYYPTERRGGCMESISRCCRQAYVYPVDKKKLLYAGGGLIGIILVAVIWTSLSSSDTDQEVTGSYILKNHPFIVGSNFFSSNLRDLVHNQVSKVNFDQNLWNDTTFGNSSCSSCQTDIPRLQSGYVSTQFWTINVSCESQYKDAVALTLEQLDAMTRLIEQYPDYLSSVLTSTEIKKNFNSNSKLISSILAINSGHSIDGRLAVLRIYKTLGVRVMGLTSTCSSDWASTYNNDTDNGLSSFGQEVVNEMNRLGILIDLSEASHQTQLDVLSNSSAPVVYTHTAAYNLSNNPRNIQDDVLELLKSRVAVVMVTFAQQYLSNSSSNATIDTVIDHLNYFKTKIGVSRLGIGAEFDGSNETYPSELWDVSTFPTLFDKLKKDGWSTDDLISLAGGNLLQVLNEAEEYATNHASDAVDEAYVLSVNVSCYSDYDTRSSDTNSSTTTATPTTTTLSPAGASTTTVTTKTTPAQSTTTTVTTAPQTKTTTPNPITV